MLEFKHHQRLPLIYGATRVPPHCSLLLCYIICWCRRSHRTTLLLYMLMSEVTQDYFCTLYADVRGHTELLCYFICWCQMFEALIKHSHKLTWNTNNWCVRDIRTHMFRSIQRAGISFRGRTNIHVLSEMSVDHLKLCLLHWLLLVVIDTYFRLVSKFNSNLKHVHATNTLLGT